MDGSTTTKLSIVPVSLADANEFVGRHHRHHQPVVGHKFSVAAAIGDKIVGVCIISRPVARFRDDGWTLEVTRMCTDGTKNACSMLYGAARRAAFALGYRRIGTYTLETEPGTSLVAAGWKLVAKRKYRTWDRPERPRVDKAPKGQKLLWEAESK